MKTNKSKIIRLPIFLSVKVNARWKKVNFKKTPWRRQSEKQCGNYKDEKNKGKASAPYVYILSLISHNLF